MERKRPSPRFNKPRNGVPRQFPPLEGVLLLDQIFRLFGEKFAGLTSDGDFIFDALIDRGTRRIWNMRSERGRGLHSSASSRMQRVWSGVELGSCAPATHMLCSSYHQDGKDGSPTAKFPPYFYSVLFALEIGKNRVPTSSWNLLPSKEEEEGKKVGDNLHSSNKMRDESTKILFHTPFGWIMATDRAVVRKIRMFLSPSVAFVYSL